MRLLVFLALVGCVLAEIAGGGLKIDSRNHVAFLGKFAYDVHPDGETVGTVQLHLRVKGGTVNDDAMAIEPPRVLFFDDEEQHWPSVYKQELTCDQVKAASIGNGSRAVSFTDNQYTSGIIGIHQRIRARWWYVALSDCNNALSQATVEYELAMRNILVSDWNTEFSVDQRGSNSLYLTLLLVYSCLLGAQLYALVLIRRTPSALGKIHPIVTLFTTSLALQWLSVLFNTAHFVAFTSDGSGILALNIAAEVLEVFSQLTFLLLLVLLAQGWTITTNEIQYRKQVVICMVLFTAAYLIALATKRTLDPASTLYIYLSAPGIVVVVLNVLAGVWFLYTLRRSYKIEQDPEKLKLYRSIGLIFTPWFITLLAMCIIAQAVAPYYQEIVVRTVTLFVNFFALSIMAFLLWPSRSESFFRITASQVGQGGGDMSKKFLDL